MLAHHVAGEADAEVALHHRERPQQRERAGEPYERDEEDGAPDRDEDIEREEASPADDQLEGG